MKELTQSMSNQVNKGVEAPEEKQSSAEESNQTTPVETTSEGSGSNEVAATAPITENTEAETENSGADQSTATEDSDENSGSEMDFGAMLEQFEQDQVTYHAGELVKGKVVGISDKGALVDFGYKSEGMVSLEEFTSDEGELTIKQGDEVEVVIK